MAKRSCRKRCPLVGIVVVVAAAAITLALQTAGIPSEDRVISLVENGALVGLNLDQVRSRLRGAQVLAVGSGVYVFGYDTAANSMTVRVTMTESRVASAELVRE